MTSTEILKGFQARLALHGLDAKACDLLIETWPTVAPCLSDAIDQFLTATGHQGPIGAIVDRHRALVKNLEMSHFTALLGGRLDGAYAELCCKTVEDEATIGLDSRMRSTAGGFVLRAAVTALARRHRLSTKRLAERSNVISQVITFDVSNAIALHRDAAETAALVHREGDGGHQGDFGVPDQHVDHAQAGG
jgi:hypothetical protein